VSATRGHPPSHRDSIYFEPRERSFAAIHFQKTEHPCTLDRSQSPLREHEETTELPAKPRWTPADWFVRPDNILDTKAGIGFPFSVETKKGSGLFCEELALRVLRTKES
jgi:hypothetical protein